MKKLTLVVRPRLSAVSMLQLALLCQRSDDPQGSAIASCSQTACVAMGEHTQLATGAAPATSCYCCLKRLSTISTNGLQQPGWNTETV